MNVWITETLLRAEMQSRDRIISQYERAIRVRRRTEGWISGYSIKTKRHASGGSGGEIVSKCQIAKDGCSTDGSSCEGGNKFDSMCTICLLEVDDGDRVADLSCGHVFHPDCLGEWILKKVCPLMLTAAKEFFYPKDFVFNVTVGILPSFVELVSALPGPRHRQGNQIL